MLPCLALGLEAATKLEITPFQEICVTLSYDLLATVENYLRKESIRTGETEYAENVTIPLLLPPAEAEQRLAELTDLTSARFTHKKGRLVSLPLKVE